MLTRENGKPQFYFTLETKYMELKTAWVILLFRNK